MRNSYLETIQKHNWRRVIAALFLLFLLVEWGSHSVIEANPIGSDAPAVSAHDLQHSDLCKTLILCSDSGRNDQQRSDLGRDMTPHRDPLGLLADFGRRMCSDDRSRLEFSTAHGLFRSISPPFHPPELS